MKKVRVGVDLDDVLIDCNTALCEFHNRRYGTSYRRADVRSFHLHEVWNCSIEEVTRRIGEFYDSPEHAKAVPIKGAVAAILKLQERDELAAVITARAESAREVTEALLACYHPSLTRLVTYTNHGKKATVCKELGVQVFVDDAGHNAEDVASVVELSLLFDAPWNRGYVPSRSNLHRVYSWQEALAMIDAMR